MRTFLDWVALSTRGLQVSGRMPVLQAGHQTLSQHFLVPSSRLLSAWPLGSRGWILSFQTRIGFNCITECQMRNQYFIISTANPKGHGLLNEWEEISET